MAVSGDTLYIADRGNDRVVSVPIAGGTQTEVASGLTGPFAVDVSDGVLYISENAGMSVVSVTTSGDDPQEIRLNGYPMGIAVSGDTIYVTSPVEDAVWSVPAAGGDITTVIEGLGGYPVAIAVGPAPCSGSSCLPVVGSLFGSLG